MVSCSTVKGENVLEMMCKGILGRFLSLQTRHNLSKFEQSRTAPIIQYAHVQQKENARPAGYLILGLLGATYRPPLATFPGHVYSMIVELRVVASV